MPTSEPVPETRYARTPDGVSIAYHTVGEGPFDLLWFHAFMGSLEVLWEREEMRSITKALASFARLIRHDTRATGLSGRAAELPDLETQVQDAVAVLDAVGSRSTVIFGAGPGAHAGSMFAATFPERTRALVLWDIYAWAGTAFGDRDLELLTRTWGTEGAAAATMAQVAPSLVADRDFLRWFAKVQRHFVPPDVAAELFRTAMETDVRPLLPAIHVPTLVLAREWPKHEMDREVAGLIDDATFVLLPGADHATFAGNQADLVGAIRDFLGAEPAVPPPQTLLRAVLFTDIVDSTTQLTRIGDAAWRELLGTHDARAAAAVDRAGGRLVKSTGDGLLAVFEGPALAVRCACEIARSVGDLGIAIRAGVHVGEVEAVGGDVLGVTVNVAARVAALAEASQVLVTSTVKDLVPGSGLLFEDAGRHELKGLQDAWRLYAVAGN